MPFKHTENVYTVGAVKKNLIRGLLGLHKAGFRP